MNAWGRVKGGSAYEAIWIKLKKLILWIENKFLSQNTVLALSSQVVCIYSSSVSRAVERRRVGEVMWLTENSKEKRRRTWKNYLKNLSIIHYLQRINVFLRIIKAHSNRNIFKIQSYAERGRFFKYMVRLLMNFPKTFNTAGQWLFLLVNFY